MYQSETFAPLTHLSSLHRSLEKSVSSENECRADEDFHRLSEESLWQRILVPLSAPVHSITTEWMKDAR